MSCCGGDIIADRSLENAEAISLAGKNADLLSYGHAQDDGLLCYVFSSPFIHCGSCIAIIEKELAKEARIKSVRVNLTLKRISLVVDPKLPPIEIVQKLEQLGYPAMPLDAEKGEESAHGKEAAKLLRALAVAGFAAMNVMLLSVSNWSGADGTTRDFFHLVSALIAIPAVAYSGQVFFRSAFLALSKRHLNMDVPISLAVILAVAMSLYETLTHGSEAYFDAAVSLLFFLLIGRYLDQMMRERARNAVSGLARLAARGANIILPSGKLEYRPLDEIRVGDLIRLVPGDRVPVDSKIVSGESDFDLSLVNGESDPAVLKEGASLLAGTRNLTSTIDIKTTQTSEKSFLAEVSRMLDAAENGRGNYVRIADRLARIYVPAVHLLALAAFIIWMVVTNGDWHTSLYVAISVLIITCPCALGLAVPVVHVIGAGKLFESGILMKDGCALERLAEIDHVLLDKTGTLTTGIPQIVRASELSDKVAGLAKSLASHSSHPSSKAIQAYLLTGSEVRIGRTVEIAGKGIEATYNGKKIRLGRPDWVGEIAGKKSKPAFSGDIAFAIEGGDAAHFTLLEKLRDDAFQTVRAIEAFGLPIEILSGDNQAKVALIAEELKLDKVHSAQTPADKIARIETLKQAGKFPLMVGDGLNDAPSLAAGHASMAPASASDIGRQAADFVFTRNDLEAIPHAIQIARKARRLIKQNFGLALAYNAIAVPLAMAGMISPLFAAIAMSTSSLVVIGNSLRLRVSQKTTGKKTHANPVLLNKLETA
jgi:Cu2+-exporting ATPase